MTVFKSTLMPHQLLANEWCLEKEVGGCVLALEMGTGKTCISLSVFTAVPVKTLVMMPLSLLSQWEGEIGRHTEGVNVAIHHGVKRMQPDQLDKIQKANIVLTTYNTVLSDYKNNKTGVYQDFERLIIDEAHKLRERKSKMHIGIRKLFVDVPRKVLLTGTPIANGIQDLVSLFCLLNHEPYNNVGHWTGMTLEEKTKELLALRKKFLLFMEAKDTIADKMPRITILDTTSEFYREKQGDVYKKILNGNIPTKTSLDKILRLRQCANEVKLMKMKDTLEMCDELSDKLSMTRKIVDTVPEGEKIVIFSQWLGMLEILQSNIGVVSVLYHGGLQKDEKDTLLESFKNDPSIKVMFMTLKSGSVGLNLTVANHVIITEPYFNAAEENQAMARVFRIGQKKDVKVYKLQISDTVENWMKQLQRTKSKVMDMLMRDIGDIGEIESEIVQKECMFTQFVQNAVVATN